MEFWALLVGTSIAGMNPGGFPRGPIYIPDDTGVGTSCGNIHCWYEPRRLSLAVNSLYTGVTPVVGLSMRLSLTESWLFTGQAGQACWVNSRRQCFVHMQVRLLHALESLASLLVYETRHKHERNIVTSGRYCNQKSH